MRVLYGLGRAVMGGFFLYNGVNHLQNTDALAGYATAKGISHPHESVKVSGVLLVLSGASMLLGLKPRFGALGTLAFLGAASPMFHDYWNQQDEQTKQAELIQFSKNVALMGAALAVLGSD